jgi:hypothetical protein
MDTANKQAYRNLLYHAMCDIRRLSYIWRTWQYWNPFVWMRIRNQVQRGAEIADWLHNLARYSALDFEGFVEEWFWQELEDRNKRFPEYGLQSYRENFQLYLGQAEQSSGPATTT